MAASADQQQTVMLQEEGVVVDAGESVDSKDVTTVVENPEQSVNEDILQQALGEVTGNLGENTIVYTTADGQIVRVEDESLQNSTTEIHLSTIANSLGPGGDTIYGIVGADGESILETEDGTIQQVALSEVESGQHDIEMGDGTVTVTENIPAEDVADHNPEQMDNGSVQEGTHSTVAVVEQEGNTTTLVTADGAPVGSSANPIRIVQQGNQYTSLQQLTPEQLAQIMQVVQQQQLSKITAAGGGSSVLFNPQTQTKIVYKVIYPSELHKNQGITSGRRIIGIQSKHAAADGKRTYKKRLKDGGEAGDGPSMSQEEKDEKKKARPRTRSGRVSRPPKHMVKDYKHIHHLDWNEPDLDDSDGGYSDYRVSEGEEEEDEEGGIRRKEGDSNYTHPGVSSGKRKNWGCETCEKAYIGRAGLARHYKLNPSHGHLEELPPDSSNKENTVNGSENSSESSVPPQANGGNPPAAPPPPRHRGPGRPRLVYTQDTTPAKRKARLRDIARVCEDEELMEIVLPRLTKAISVWEFLLMKVEKGKPLKPHFTDIYREFEILHKKVLRMCQDCLKPAVSGEPNPNNIEINDAKVAESLGFQTGQYVVKDKTDVEMAELGYTSHIKPEKIEEPPAKRVCIEQPHNLASNDVNNTRGQVVVIRPPGVVAHPQVRTVTQGINPSTANIVQVLPHSAHMTQVKSNPVVYLSSQPSIVSSTQPAAVSQVVTNNIDNFTNVQQDSTQSMQNVVVVASDASQSMHVASAPTQSMQNVAIVAQPPDTSQSIQNVAIVAQPPDTSQSIQNVAIVAQPPDTSQSVQNVSIVAQTPDTSQSIQNVAIVAQTPDASQSIQNMAMVASTQDTTQSMQNVAIVAQAQNTPQSMQNVAIVAQAQDTSQSLQNVAIMAQTQEDPANIKFEEVQAISDVKVEEEPENQVDTQEQITYVQEGDYMEEEAEEGTMFQTESGVLLIRNPDGTFHVHSDSDQGLTLETVQALLAMDVEGQVQVHQLPEQGS